MEELTDKKLLFFCGKGGVGKTATSLATALHAAEKGKKVLLFSLTSIEYVEDCFGVNVTDEPTKLGTNLYCLELDMQKGVEEVLRNHLKSKKLAKTLMGNTIFQSVVEAMTGFKEMLALGKILEYENDYDLLVMDSPATGHSITFLNSPQKVMSLVKKGDIYEMALKVEGLLKDKSRTSANIVTILEEMAVNEAYELSALLGKAGISLDYVIINQIESLRSEHEELMKQMLKDPKFEAEMAGTTSKSYPVKFFGQVVECNSAVMKRQDESMKYHYTLTSKVKASFREVPIVYSEDKIGLLKMIGGYLF